VQKTFVSLIKNLTLGRADQHNGKKRIVLKCTKEVNIREKCDSGNANEEDGENKQSANTQMRVSGLYSHLWEKLLSACYEMLKKWMQ
jgi:hypothetical protein